MLNVLSTKLKAEEINRFVEMAEQHGESKSGMVRRLVLDYLDDSSKADRVASTGTSNPANSTNKGLLTQGEGLNSKYIPPVHHQPQTKMQKCTSVVDSGLPIHKDGIGSYLLRIVSNSHRSGHQTPLPLRQGRS